MATQTAKLLTNDRAGYTTQKLVFSGGTPGTLNGATEFGFVLPAGSWRLTEVTLAAGVNTTHTTSTPLITLSVEKNTDGGTSALTTAPSLDNTAGTGYKSTIATATGIVVGVPKTDADGLFTQGQVAFVTLSETGASGTDPSDVFFNLVFTRDSDFDATA